MGYLPEALRNYLMRLGWSHGDDEIISTEDAIRWFDIADVNRAPARLDLAKLDSVNAHYIRIADDDRSSYLASLMDARKDAGDSTGARKAAEAWSTFLDGAAARAKTPDQRVVFDSHRLSAYIELGQPERAFPMLQQSQRDYPDDYNPPARLAAAYNAMKQWDDAIASTDRALKLAYGPRKLRIYSARVDAYTGKGDAAAARKTLEESIAYAEALPPGQRSESTIAALKKKLDGMAGTP